MLLEVTDLAVGYDQPDGSVKEVVHDVSLTVRRGEVHGLIGESGSGKTQTAWSVMQLLPNGGHVTGGIHPVRGCGAGERVGEGHAQTPRPEDRLHPAGADVEPRPVVHHRVSAGRADAGMPVHLQEGGHRTRVGAARPGRDPEPPADFRLLPASGLRRHGAAGADRRGGVLRTRPADRGRADHRAGCHGAGRGAGSAPLVAGGDEHGRHPGHAQLRCGRRHLRPGVGDAARPGRRDRAGAVDLLPPRARVHPGTARRHPAGGGATRSAGHRRRWEHRHRNTTKSTTKTANTAGAQS